MTTELICELLEALTILSFGISWPISIRKSYISRTAKGKSLMFEVIIFIGYLIGLVRKFIQLFMLNADGFIFFLGFFFYFMNACMIFIDMMLWKRNRKLDAEREAAKK